MRPAAAVAGAGRVGGVRRVAAWGLALVRALVRAQVKAPVMALALVACVPLTAQAASPARPNIVVLVADDWGFSDLGAFGGEISTPQLDALAQRGMRFSNFHVAASCAPTRSMLLTGVDNHKNGVGNLREAMPREHLGQPGYGGSLATHVVTVSELLQGSGYRTYVAGKWNVGSEPHNLPNQRGFDRSIVQGDTGSDNWEPDRLYLPHRPQVDWFEGGQRAVMPKEFYSSAYFVDRMLEYLRADAGSGKPFFAYVGFQANHVPVQAPQSFIDKYKGRYKGGWTALRQARRDRAIELGLVPKGTAMVTMSTTRDWAGLSAKERQLAERQMEVYAAMAEAMDHHVGRLVAHLQASGEFDNTVFVFLSDNGAEGSDYHEAQSWLRLMTPYTQDADTLGGKRSYGIPGPGWASASVSPLSGYKFWSGEGGIRTPMFISGVAGARAGAVHAGLAHVTDMVPTLLDLAQVARPTARHQGREVLPLDGLSLLPVLKGEARQVRSPDQPLGYELSGNQALFKGDLKLVRNRPPLGDNQWHLFNLRSDPGEARDLQQQLPEAFQALQADYGVWARANGVLPVPDGYSPQRQVMINSWYNYWWPTYGALLVVMPLMVLVALGLLVKFWRQRRR